jgi:hypothetical protein
MATQPHLVLSAVQRTLVEKIKPAAGVIFPRRHGATTALVHYVHTHAKEAVVCLAPSQRLANKFKADTGDAAEAYSEAYVPCGLTGFVLLDACTSANALVLTPLAFTVFSPKFTVPQARKLWFKGTAACMVVMFRTLGGSADNTVGDGGVHFSDDRVWCRKNFRIGDDMDALIQDMRTKIIACVRVYGDSTEEVFIQEPVYLEGDDLARVVRIQLE